MKKYKAYPNKRRIITVKVALTTDQIAVLLNHAIYQSRPLNVAKEVQFAVDWLCSGENVYAEAAGELSREGYKPLAFDSSLLPDPQDEASERRRQKHLKRSRSC